MEEDFQSGPSGTLEESPSSWGKDEGVPSSDCEGTNEEILVSAEMGREVKGVWEEGSDVWSRHGWVGIPSVAHLTIYNPLIPRYIRNHHMSHQVFGGLFTDRPLPWASFLPSFFPRRTVHHGVAYQCQRHQSSLPRLKNPRILHGEALQAVIFICPFQSHSA